VTLTERNPRTISFVEIRMGQQSITIMLISVIKLLRWLMMFRVNHAFWRQLDGTYPCRKDRDDPLNSYLLSDLIFYFITHELKIMDGQFNHVDKEGIAKTGTYVINENLN
jgi:hypothetical protein